jgi:hypothetical protein
MENRAARRRGFKVVDSHGQSLAYVYGHADKREAETAGGWTLDGARRPAVVPCLIYCVKTEVPSSHVVAMMPRKSH